MMRSISIPLLIPLISLVLGQRLIIPNTIKSCQPTNITWEISPQEVTDIYLTFKATLSGGASYTLDFFNVPPEGFSFLPIFSPGSQLSVRQTLSDPTEISVEDGGSDCVFQYADNTTNTVLSAVEAALNETTPLAFNPLRFAHQCSNYTLSWSGGVAPYKITMDGPPDSFPSVAMLIEDIPGTIVQLALPFPSSTSPYAIYLSDSVNSNTSFSTLTITSPRGPFRDCLLHPNSLGPIPSTSPMIPSSSASSSTGSSTNTTQSNTHQTTIIAVSVTVGVLVLGIISAILITRRVFQKRRQTKLRLIQDRFKEGRQQWVQLEEVKSPQPQSPVKAEI